MSVVREHHAPVGALRPKQALDLSPFGPRQGAPRTCRCIETGGFAGGAVVGADVREHHAPVGALRRVGGDDLLTGGRVREHHAPVGALRHRARFPLSQYYRVREYHAPDEVDVQLVVVVSGSTAQL